MFYDSQLSPLVHTVTLEMLSLFYVPFFWEPSHRIVSFYVGNTDHKNEQIFQLLSMRCSL